MTDVHEQLGALTDEQRQLLDLLLQQEGVDVAQAVAIPRTVATDAPLSSAQRRLWLTEQLVNGSLHPNPHILHHVFRVRGDLDSAALEGALRLLAQRHEIVRTVYTVVDGEPRQAVEAAKPGQVMVRDLRAMPDTERGAAADAIVAEAVRRPFDLSETPLLRVELLRLGDDEAILALTAHLMIADGLSDGLLLQDLRDLYSVARGDASPIPDLPVQYADYARWQADAIERARARDLEYWLARLRGAPARQALPTDRALPTVPTFRGSFVPFDLAADVSAALRARCREAGVTPFMAFVAALQVLLHTYSGQEDVVVATTVSSRGRPELERLLGSFANVLMLRTVLAGEPSWRDVLALARETAIGAVGHQDLPIEDVLGALMLDGAGGAAPQLQVMVVLHEHSAETDFALAGLRVESIPVDRGGALYELYLRVTTTGDLFGGSLEYSSDLFDRGTALRIAEDLRVVLSRLAAGLDLPALAELDSPLVGRAPAASKPLARSVSPGGSTPLSGAERRVADIWCEVLRLEAVGRDESFFELGGRSLQLVLVNNLLKDAFGRALPIVTLFEHPTVRALAAFLSGSPTAALSVQAEVERANARRAARGRRAAVHRGETGTRQDAGGDDD